MTIFFTTRRLACLTLALLLGVSDPSTATVLADEEEAQTPTAYTAWDDVSWAVKSRDISSQVVGDHIAPLYKNYINGCDEASVARGHPAHCEQNDNQRLTMNEHQPSSVYNYTKLGFQKIRAPKELFDIIQAFYIKNKHRATTEWADLNTYHNMWEAPPTIFHLNQARHGGGVEMQAKIWHYAQPILERWTGQMLSPVSLYGIRTYHNNSILAPHVDRMPLVISAIINVDQDVEEPWPLEVYGHDEKATNVTMRPGDMVLYESHSVIHGRPFPLKGKYYANCFLHFEPIGPLNPEMDDEGRDASVDIPPYLIHGSYWERTWRSQNQNGWKKQFDDAHAIAKKGDVRLLRRLARIGPPKALHKPDKAGWHPLHEAVRAGHVESVQFLLLNGADVNHATRSGHTPLDIAKSEFGADHEMIKFLTKMGAHEMSKFLTEKGAVGLGPDL